MAYNGASVGGIVFSPLWVFLSAQAVFGAARWFQVGVLFIQPTEFAKIAVILLLARYFDRTQNQRRDLRWIIGAFFWVMGLGIWILLQPNLSNVIVLMVIFGSLLWFNGLQLKHLLIFGLIGFIALASIVGLSAAGIRIPFLQEYQQQRIVTADQPTWDGYPAQHLTARERRDLMHATNCTDRKQRNR